MNLCLIIQGRLKGWLYIYFECVNDITEMCWIIRWDIVYNDYHKTIGIIIFRISVRINNSMSLTDKESFNASLRPLIHERKKLIKKRIYIHIWNQSVVITVRADILVHNCTRSPAGTVLTKKLNMFSSKFLCPWMITLINRYQAEYFGRYLAVLDIWRVNGVVNRL